MPRKYRLVLAVVALIALFGYRYWQSHSAKKPGTATTATPAKDAEPVKQRHYGTLAFKPCTLSTPMAREGVTAQCTTFTVPENREQPNGRKIALNIAWVPANEGAELAPDPVFFIAGGPGQSAVKSYPQLAGAFDRILDKRDVILVDQRGTGESNPLKCGGKDENGDPTEAETLADVEKATRDCVAELSKVADLTRYDTTTAVADLDAVRKAMGIEKINLMGVSYGTRVAQQYAMRYPNSTRTIVLDSVVPNTTILGNIWARNLEDALDQQFALCTRNADCVKAVGNPRDSLNTVMATLRKGPVPVTYRDPTTGIVKTDTLKAEEVANLVRMFAYMPAMAALIPQQLHEASQGRYDSLKAMTDMLNSGLEDQMMMGMQMSVICTEDGDSVVSNDADKDTVLGTTLTDAMAAMCKIWPKGKMPADFHNALATDVPALILEGELDPVTPPKYGEETLKTLKNGRLFVLRGQGHNVIGVGCMPKLFAKFIDTADAKQLDGKCLDNLSYTPPFTSYNGWTP